MKRWISSLSLWLGLLATGAAFAENLFRWVDEQGEVHFTPTLPPDHADKPYDIYSSNGILIERVTDPMKHLREEQAAAAARAAYGKDHKPIPLYSEEEKKVMGDRLLLLKYRNEGELVDAMNLEIDHLKYDERILEASHQSLMNSLAGQITVAASRQRAGLAIEDKQRQEIDHLRNRLRNNQAEMQRMAERKAKIRSDFDQELQHYRSLLEQAEEAPTGD